MSEEHRERREYNLQMAEDIGSIKAMLEGLAGPQGRVTALEDDAKTAERRQWIHSAVVIPLVTAFHLGAKKLGL